MSDIIIETALKVIEKQVRINPKNITQVTRAVSKLQKKATNLVRLNKLRQEWTEVPNDTLDCLMTEQSAPFVILMLSLIKRGYKPNQVSLVLWWRRLCATGLEHTITYFSWDRFDKLMFSHNSKVVYGQDIMRVCVETEVMLKDFSDSLNADNNVEYRIRELLGGLSLKADVKKAFKEWAMANHPDKGGDPEQFLKVKLVYDEWIHCHTTTNNNNNNQT